MNYAGVTTCSFINGEGARVVLWVSGCNHQCKGCQNPELWNPDSGKLFTNGAALTIVDKCQRPYIDGLTLSGGDPMYPDNRQVILELCRFFKSIFDDKTIWMYTGYDFEDIKDEPVLEYIDVVVDGKYMEERKSENSMWRGSDNQRIWRKEGKEWKLGC